MQPCPDQALGAPSRVTAGYNRTIASEHCLDRLWLAQPPVFWKQRFLRCEISLRSAPCRWRLLDAFVFATVRLALASVTKGRLGAVPARCRNPCVKKAHRFLVQAVGRVASNRPWPDFVRTLGHSETLTSNSTSKPTGLVKRVQHSTGGTTHQSFRSHATQFIRCTTPSSA